MRMQVVGDTLVFDFFNHSILSSCRRMGWDGVLLFVASI